MGTIRRCGGNSCAAPPHYRCGLDVPSSVKEFGLRSFRRSGFSRCRMVICSIAAGNFRAMSHGRGALRNLSRPSLADQHQQNRAGPASAAVTGLVRGGLCGHYDDISANQVYGLLGAKSSIGPGMGVVLTVCKDQHAFFSSGMSLKLFPYRGPRTIGNLWFRKTFPAPRRDRKQSCKNKGLYH